MRRRALLTSFSSLTLISLTGCLSMWSSNAETAELDYVEAWNSNDSPQTFHVVLLDADGEQTFEQTTTVDGAAGNRYNREKLTEAPATAATVQATVNGETAEKELSGYESPVLVSVKYNDDGQLGIAGFV